MRMRIEADAELTPEEDTAVREAVQRYLATAEAPAPATTEHPGWTGTARLESMRGAGPTGPRAAWQEARDRGRPAREAG
jgi:hypothetical protein